MEPLAAGLSAVLSRLAHDPEGALAVLEEMWPEIAGAELSRRVRPVEVEERCLWLEVDDPEWRQPVISVSAALLSRIEQLLGAGRIEKIRLRMRLDAHQEAASADSAGS